MPTVNTTMKDHKSLFRQLLQGMYDAVVITDPSGHVLELNPRAREFFQWEAEEVLDRPISLFVPGITPEMLARLRKGLDQSRHMLLDANCQRKDGSRFAAEVSVSSLDLVDPGDLVFTMRNMERRRRQLAAFRTKENLCAVSQTALFACAPEGAFRWVNPAFLALFGFETEEEALRHVFADVLDDEPLPELFARALAGEKVQVRLQAEDEKGGSENVEVSLAPDVQVKKIVGVVGSVFRT